MKEKRTLLIFTDWFLPAFKAGGPIRSIYNLCEALKDQFIIKIYTSDHDLNSSNQLSNITTDQWVQYEGLGEIYYCSERFSIWASIKKVMLETGPTTIYLNSMFSLRYTVLPLVVSFLLRGHRSIILNPRGMLMEHALKQKFFKKRLFLKVFKFFKIHQKITWQFTDVVELRSAQAVFQQELSHVLLSNFPTIHRQSQKQILKQVGSADLLFIGRIHLTKNLYFLLEILTKVKVEVNLTICGVIEDHIYWQKCCHLIDSMPKNIQVKFMGPVGFESITDLLSKHHFLVSPTRGENFGHAIFESLSAGRPVLISDQTPWRGLEQKGIGWDVSLEDQSKFRTVIQEMTSLSQDPYDLLCRNALSFVAEYEAQSDLKSKYLRLFNAQRA